MAKYEIIEGGSNCHKIQKASFRSDFIDIALGSPDIAKKGSELEYKVRMNAGDTIVYSWTISGLSDPELLHYDLHGEEPAMGDTAISKVVEYIKGNAIESHGTMTALIPGVHGWYLQNRSKHPLIVHLKLSGFYELVNPGEYGNQSEIKANISLLP